MVRTARSRQGTQARSARNSRTRWTTELILVNRNRDRRRTGFARRKTFLPRDPQRVCIATRSLRHSSRLIVSNRHDNSLRAGFRFRRRGRRRRRSNGGWILSSFRFSRATLFLALAFQSSSGVFIRRRTFFIGGLRLHGCVGLCGLRRG